MVKKLTLVLFLLGSAPAQEGKVTGYVRFRTDRVPVEVYLADGEGRTWCQTQGAQTQLLVAKDRPFMVAFGVRPRILSVPKDLPADPQ